jgi:hypothetical protein
LKIVADTKSNHNNTTFFHTHCTANRKVCDVILDGGNGKNIVPKVIVAKLGMKTEKHPSAHNWVDQVGH